MLNVSEIKTVRDHGGNMHRNTERNGDDQSFDATCYNRPRLMLRDASDEGGTLRELRIPPSNGNLGGIYSHVSLTAGFDDRKREKFLAS